ncbi:serine hydrolase domain-containing protein [Saccharibacillus kuerlensis]|uniref:6-aminohexanoate-dimer hydrolase n=1 Tax=Saccharibacillus kuerlensis TaxID=459527 RepID=A0ABQ2L286_9BACL|nr:serine hydrolase [Saccharibacillus kuerlensis]GGN99611.1 6-aminohexanoate-dimer hydrolase [Saccharibacillus kuerlensis]
MPRSVPLIVSSGSFTPTLPTSSPLETGTDEFPLLQADRAVPQSHPKLRSFLLLRGGNLIFERYYGDAVPETLHDLRSATKSFTAALFGIAYERQGSPYLDGSIFEHLESIWPKDAHPLAKEITLRQLLTMTSGSYWKTGRSLGEALLRPFHRSRSWVSFALRLPVMPEQRGTFTYRSTDSHLLSAILTSWTGEDAFTFAQRELFGPLGIRSAAWSPVREGASAGHIGLALTARDLARFGQCCLEGGMYEGSRILPSDWTRQMLSTQTAGYEGFGDYGFQWWTGELDGVPYACAHGHGGQQIYVLPSLDAVAVFTSESRVSRYKNPRQLMRKFVLPALKDSGS